jgi:hypothetical protein
MTSTGRFRYVISQSVHLVNLSLASTGWYRYAISQSVHLINLSMASTGRFRYVISQSVHLMNLSRTQISSAPESAYDEHSLVSNRRYRGVSSRDT